LRSAIAGPGIAPARFLPARFLNVATLLAVLGCALAAVLVWAAVNRPVTPPDFRGRVAGLARRRNPRRSQARRRHHRSRAQLHGRG
jgi:hypothetical protein